MKITIVIAGLLLLSVATTEASIVDAPHNMTNNITCGDCHNYSWWWQFSPVDSDPEVRGQKADELCLRCHGGYDPDIVSVINHSSISIGVMHRISLGDFTNACVDCHDPHFQAQLNWQSAVPDNDLFLVTGVMLPGTMIIAGQGTSASPYTTTFQYQDITVNGNGWDNTTTPWNAKNGKSGRGLLLALSADHPENTYEIISVDEESSELTVNGKIDPLFNDTGTNFGLIYGQLIRDYVEVDSLNRDVKFFDNKGGFVNTETYEGICQVCHTRTRNFRNAGGINFDDYIFDHTSKQSENCIACHSHSNGMAHGGDSGDAEECQECHGHDAGGSDFTGGKGTFATHSTHTENDLDDARGPNLGCDGCHNISSIPDFKDGVTYSAYKSGVPTTVCNTCHSNQGTYDGVSDPQIGAIANWENGVYEPDGTLKPGKEKWCATCHDEVPSVINGIPAPNVIGDEDGSYKYGSGWGYYTTGHGLDASENYPSKGNIETLAGRPIECSACHDLTLAHIDADARSFDCGVNQDECDPAEYRTSYRLRMVDGQFPMEVPKIGTHVSNPNNADQFRLCAQCHSPEPFTDAGNFNTNFATWNSSDPPAYINQHANHLTGLFPVYPPDYNYTYADLDDDGQLELVTGSRPTCVTCHNVHGSTNLAMVRSGELINREPGLMIWYANKDLVEFDFTSNPPVPENVPLEAGTGLIWYRFSTSNLCNGCHGGPMSAEYRCEDPADCTSYIPPFQPGALQPPVLSWTGENGYSSNGVEPENAGSGSLFSFRVKYTDVNNDAPTAIQLWIDKDDDGVYENNVDPDLNEKIDMAEIDTRDISYLDGKLYGADITLYKAGDNILMYQFQAVSNGIPVDLPAASDPGVTVSIINNSPVLSWAGEPHFTTEGVYPNSGGLAGNYQFRVKYSDADGECPVGDGSIQVWIDENDNGYEIGEKHNLIEESAGDTNCADGKIYQLTRSLSVAGSHNYTFAATDGQLSATGETGPTNDNKVIVNATANTPPQLQWYAAGCVANGVKPALGAVGENFEFAMQYTDPDGCPSAGVFEVWLDLDGDGYSSSEQHTMLEDDPADIDCTDGKVYRLTTAISTAGVYNYRFHANDGFDDGVGEATATRTVEAIEAIAVHPVAGTTLQDVISPSHDVTILVYEGTYIGNISLSSGQTNNSNITLKSVCGPESTTLQGIYVDNAATGTVGVVGVSNPVIDGFTITGGFNGIVLNGGLTVKNCIIENNRRGIYTITTSSALKVENTVIQNNEIIGGGGGIYFNSGGPHSISGSTIINNRSTNGGGIFLQNSSLGLTIEETTISNNSSTASGAGIYVTRSKLDADKVTINANIAEGGGGGMYLKENSFATMINSNIVDNTAGSYGGGVFLGNYNNAIGNLKMTNCTVSDNKLTDTTGGIGGGIYDRLSNVSINNSIFRGNEAAGRLSAHEAYAWLGADNTFSFTNSAVVNNPDNFRTLDGSIDFEATCIEADPMFVDSNNGDYHLKSISPAIDQGMSVDGLLDDIDGDLRPQDSGYDMGSDEYLP